MGWKQLAKAGTKLKVVPKDQRKKVKFRRGDAYGRKDVRETKWTPKTVDDDLISVKEACWHNHYGECHFLECDISECHMICPNWCCFHEGYLKMLGLKKPKKFPPMKFHDLWLQNTYVQTIYQVVDEGQVQIRLEGLYVEG